MKYDANACRRLPGEERIDFEDRRWRRRRVGRVEARIAAAVEKIYCEVGLQCGRYEANQAVDRAGELLDACRRYPVPMDADEDEIRQAAEVWSSKCFSSPGSTQPKVITRGALRGVSPARVAHAERTCRRAGIEPATFPRMVDDMWWRRRLRQGIGRAVEQAARVVGLVTKWSGIYCSDYTVERRADQNRRNARIVAAIEAVSGETVLDLESVVAASLANPRNRHAELIARVSGAEAAADRAGDMALFLTLTCPSKYHARHAKTGKPNAKYEGATAREAQEYLVQLWARVRAQWAKAGLESYGLRIAEPHHDGCPHWHLILFCKPEARGQVIAVLRAHALAEDGEENGAAGARLKVVEIDKNKGSATAYVVKYITKAITGDGMTEDRDGTPVADIAGRVRAWASVWGIRQFQFWGLPTITPYRELRRLRDGMPGGPHAAAWAAADAGDFGAYIEATKRVEIKTARAWSDKLNKYDEPRGWRIVGVEVAGVTFATRFRTWTLQRKRAVDLPRKPGNNCNLQPVGGIGNGNTSGSVWGGFGGGSGVGGGPVPDRSMGRGASKGDMGAGQRAPRVPGRPGARSGLRGDGSG